MYGVLSSIYTVAQQDVALDTDTFQNNLNTITRLSTQAQATTKM